MRRVRWQKDMGTWTADDRTVCASLVGAADRFLGALLAAVILEHLGNCRRCTTHRECDQERDELEKPRHQECL